MSLAAPVTPVKRRTKKTDRQRKILAVAMESIKTGIPYVHLQQSNIYMLVSTLDDKRPMQLQQMYRTGEFTDDDYATIQRYRAGLRSKDSRSRVDAPMASNPSSGTKMHLKGPQKPARRAHGPIGRKVGDEIAERKAARDARLAENAEARTVQSVNLPVWPDDISMVDRVAVQDYKSALRKFGPDRAGALLRTIDLDMLNSLVSNRMLTKKDLENI